MKAVYITAIAGMISLGLLVSVPTRVQAASTRTQAIEAQVKAAIEAHNRNKMTEASTSGEVEHTQEGTSSQLEVAPPLTLYAWWGGRIKVHRTSGQLYLSLHL